MNRLFPDIFAIVISLLLIVVYYLHLYVRSRRHPGSTIQAVNHQARSLWVAAVMSTPGKDIMAVQTLRNFEMAATFKASTAVLLIIGTLTLSAQSQNLAQSWHLLGHDGPHTQDWWVVKVICLLAALIVAFFSFSMSIRNLNHVLFMLALTSEDAQGALAPERVARRLNQAGSFYTVGMRAYLAAVPLVFWLFGPLFLLMATIGLVGVLYYMDRNPDIGQSL